MNSLLQSFLLLFAASSVTFADSNDFINFENDDTLHGKFIGLTTSGKIIWKNNSAEENIAFNTDGVRKIVLNKGHKTKPFSHTSYVTLKNLDTVPGEIISLTNEQLTLQTDFAGKILIPKEDIFDIYINPVSDKIIYRGPYNPDEGWETKFPSNRISRNLTPEEQEEQKPWQFKNFSLNHFGEPSSILLKKDLPDKFRITFNSYSSMGYYPSLVFAADLKVPEFDEDDKELQQNRSRYMTSLGSYLGTSLVINLRPTSPSLSQNGFKEDGSQFQINLANLVNNFSTSGTNTKIFYDLRVDKKSGNIMFFANKRMIGNWQIDSLAEQFQGSYFGFSMQYNSMATKSVISDIVISSWNGVQDSALSLENESRDIVMLNNGTDRFSGKIISINNSEIALKSAYADLTIPQEQVSSITFSGKKSEQSEPRDKNDVTVRFYGTGKITGILTKGDEGDLLIESKILGKIKLKAEYINSLEFVDMDFAYEVSQ